MPWTRRANAWLALFRPPNLFTAPGDPLSGALLAGVACGQPFLPAKVGFIAGAALLLYASGLLANDYLDRAIDAQERPQRPIPSGAVNARHVLVVALLLTAGGILLALQAGIWPALLAGGTMVAVWFYNSIGKRNASLGPISMGLCRGSSLLMGAAIVGPAGLAARPVLISAFMLTIIIALITRLARDEARTEVAVRTPLVARWGIPFLVLIWMTTSRLLLSPPASNLGLVLAAMAVLWASVWVFQLRGEPSPDRIPAVIGALLRGLLFIQAALCAFTGTTGDGVALLLILAFPVSGWAGKWFYGS